MFNKNVITKAVVLGSVSSTALISSQVFAQETDAQVKEVEKIQVTGSRIKRSDMETASPVTVIGADEILASGANSIDQILQKTTAASGAMVNPGINNGSGGNATINLRGLGSARTLVLVNGRRMVNSGTGAASSVDLNTIPVSMIQRVEVLKDGASAVYGSDAIAGVVNIILKKDFEGLELNTSGQMTDKGDAEEYNIDLTVGTEFDKGNIVLGVQYMDRGEASQADRKFSECPIAERTNAAGELELFCAGSSYTPYGHIWGPNGESLQGEAGNGWHDFSDADRYNYSSTSYLFTPMKKFNVTGLANYELTDDLNLFSEVTYAKRWSEQQMAPQPVWFDFTYENWMGDSLISHGLNYGDELSYGRRMTDTGARGFSQVVDTFRNVIGVEGFLDNGWTWDLSYNFGRNDSVDRLANLHNMGSIGDAIKDGTFNPLDQASWETENLSPYIYTEQNSGGSQVAILAASLSGELFELPAGYVGFASGIENRKEKAWFIPDSLTSQGLANDPRVEETRGGFEVNEAYVELAVPLIADSFLADSVELSTAIRYFDYSTFGDDFTWKLGLTWKVYEDLMLRSVASTAFRAPTVDELYGGKSPSFDQVSHPIGQDQAEVTVGGNPMLQPEEADTFTVGLVYEPSFVDGLSLTADYYSIEIDNAIAQVSSQYIVDQCLDAAGNPINTGSALCQSANISMDNSNRIIFNNTLQNIGASTTKGIDLNVSYLFEAGGLDWKASVDSTFLLESEEVILDETIDYVGIITSGSGGYADIKSNFTLTARADDWDATYKARFISGMDSYACLDDPSGCYAPSTPSVVYHDVSASYHVTDQVTLSGGINNLFDKTPPYYTGNNDSNTDPYTYDVLGRTLFARATVRF
ncbi:TonB-dependent receptor plug domain-containing protein [Thalassotalea agarivorans]|uniref:Iron complex outermembrane recepter protein n=1 Tax=Thalassotalea agarivorans TaxID=349064 RepID=A0A1H9YDI6_THASX|nr:TonB-dependent receptor [Thalassotalea agarivorans]SES67041.1 iron complex outermembrane recepter protein [Thalassotalea agarivorans]